MVILPFILLTGGIGPGVRLILAVAAPRDDVLAKGGACFIDRVHNECLVVEWEVCICLGFGFST